MSLTALIRTPNVRKKSLILFSSWFVTGLTYYGLSLNSAGDFGAGGADRSAEDAKSAAYLTFTFYGLIEAPAIVVSIVSTITAGRRPTLTLLLVGTGISCVGAGVIPQGMFPGEEFNHLLYICSSIETNSPFRKLALCVTFCDREILCLLHPACALRLHV